MMVWLSDDNNFNLKLPKQELLCVYEALLNNKKTEKIAKRIKNYLDDIND